MNDKQDKYKETLTKLSVKLNDVSSLLQHLKVNEQLLKEKEHANKINAHVKSILIESILDYDKLIQAYVVEDQPKNIDELKRLSIKQLSCWLNVRSTYCQHIIDQDTIN